MAKSRIDDSISKVLALRERFDASELRAAFEHKHARVVLAATQVLEGLDAGSGGWPEASAAFVRLLGEREPHKHDPMCRAKVGLVRAMLHLEAESERIAYERGRRYVQNEPAFGGPTDTAAELRGLCVLGLVRTRHPDASVFAAEALADPQRATRLGAAHALAELPPDAALPVLRYKLAVSDAEPEITGAVFAGFLELAPTLALSLAPELLHGDDGEAIALALGESKKREAFAVLRDAVPGVAASVVFVAMSLLRDEEANAYLLDAIASGAHAEAALKALAHFRHDPKLRERTLAAVKQRGDKTLSASAQQLLAL
jgi:hypothetical protein